MTVSRVIKGTGGVGPSTRERVLRIAEELNYTANLAARALATGKTGVVAIMSGGLNQYYYASIVHLLESQLRTSGYQMRLLHTESDLKDVISSTNAAVVDGVIIAGQHYVVEDFRSLEPYVLPPYIFIDTLAHTGTDHVHSNLRPAVREALELMAQKGSNRVAYVAHFGGVSSSAMVEERMSMYLSFMEGKGWPSELIGIDWEVPLRQDTLKSYLEERGCPDALLCVNDETAMYVYRTLRDVGYRIPDDVLLVGCDGLPFMECFDPPLSTIAQPLEEICARAWEFLQARIANPDLPIQQATFDAQLVIRKSLQS